MVRHLAKIALENLGPLHLDESIPSFDAKIAQNQNRFLGEIDELLIEFIVNFSS